MREQAFVAEADATEVSFLLHRVNGTETIKLYIESSQVTCTVTTSSDGNFDVDLEEDDGSLAAQALRELVRVLRQWRPWRSSSLESSVAVLELRR